VKIAALGIANAMLSFGLLMTEAHANETETSQPPPAWVDLRLNFTAQPVVGIARGLEPSASSWMQQVAAGLTLGTGLDKHRSNRTGFDHWQIQLELNQFTGNPKLNEQLGTDYPLQSLVVVPTGTWITKASLERIEGENKIDWSMNAGVISIENNAMEISALDYYTNHTLNTPYNVSIIGLPITPLVALGWHTNNSGASITRTTT
jgi:porin